MQVGEKLRRGGRAPYIGPGRGGGGGLEVSRADEDRQFVDGGLQDRGGVPGCREFPSKAGWGAA